MKICKPDALELNDLNRADVHFLKLFNLIDNYFWIIQAINGCDGLSKRLLFFHDIF